MPPRPPLLRDFVPLDLLLDLRVLDVLRVPVADLRVPLVVLRADDLAAPDERLEPVPEDLARAEDDFFFAPPLRDRDDDFFAPPLLEREAEEELPAPPERPLPLELPLELSLGDHLPDMTRCAASATASAMIEPSLVALDMTLLAADVAVSAASRPASRIFLRAAGLALIAAAAAASPAASISLLIAAFASLSTVLSFEREREPDELLFDFDFDFEEREELFRADLAICCLPPSRGKTL